MSVNYLEQVLRREREDAAVFTPLPHHYLEIASLLLNTASDDVGELAAEQAGRIQEFRVVSLKTLTCSYTLVQRRSVNCANGDKCNGFFSFVRV